MVLREEGAPDAVEFLLRRPVAQRDDGEAELTIAGAERLVEDFIVARQAEHAELAHGRHNGAGDVAISIGRDGCRLHGLFTTFSATGDLPPPGVAYRGI